MKFVKKWKPEVDKEIMKSLVGTVPEVWERSKDYFLRGGKRLRPALVLLGAKEAGGTETKSLRVAAAIEIMHTFTLIHDDIEDSSEFRRGDRCLHKQYGIPLAINTGDALFAKSFQLFTEESQELANEFAKTMCTIVEGQELDISWSKENRIPTEAEYISMVEKKTSELIGFSLEAGYMSASGKRSPKLREYGKRLGVAFQIIDDILGVAGNPDKTGKDVDKDIGERKKSLPIIHAIENHPKGNEIKRVLEKRQKTKEDIEFVRGAIKESGSLEYCKKLADEYVGKAKYDFKNKKVAECLKGLKEFILKREF